MKNIVDLDQMASVHGKVLQIAKPIPFIRK